MQAINWRAVLYINGFLLLALSIGMLLPPLCDHLFFETNNNLYGFYTGFLICFIIGSSFVLGNRQHKTMKMGMREAFLITTLVWVVLSFFSSIPYFLTLESLTFLDAVFESVSSITTTGASIFKDVEQLPQTILLWRSLLQWFGGIGIIVIAMSFFPALRLGGMQLFRSEFSDRYEKILPKISQITASILSYYISFTLICAILYNWFGMSGFDAICHALCTISTGGLSTHTLGLAHFNSVGIEIVASIFMIIGGTTMVLFIRFINHEKNIFFKDKQFITFIITIVFFSALFTFWLWYGEHKRLLESFRLGYFNIIASLTTTGYSNTDTLLLGSFSHMLFLLLGLIGGCTGSTTGGIKIFRIQVIWTIIHNHIKQLRRPHVVLLPKFQGYKITDHVALSVFTLFSLYILVLFVLTLALCASGLDMWESFSCVSSVVGNLGVSTDHILTSVHQGHISISPFAKIVLMFGMICGRLEILTVVILLMPSFWKK